MLLSVIVPVHNGVEVLPRCLESLAQSDFRDFECLVVDDASADASRAVAARYGATLLALEHRGGPARARNRGATHARGEILVFVDADVQLHSDTLGRIATHFRTHPGTAALMGSYDEAPTDPGFVSQYKNLLHHYTHQVSRRQAWTFWAGCGAVRRRVFLDTGGFDEAYRRPCVEDIELGFRLRAGGYRIDLDPSVQVTHLKRWTFLSMVRTDLCDRAVPWLLLMLRTRTMPRDLNVRLAHRVSAVAVFLMVPLALAVLGAPAWRTSWTPYAALAGLAGTLLLLNHDLYRFFARKRGVRFAAATLPLHWLYYFYCGVAVALGTGVYLQRRLGRVRRRSAPWPRTAR